MISQKKLIVYILLSVVCGGFSYAAQTNNTSDQVQMLNQQIQAQMQKMQDDQQKQMQTMNTKLEAQIQQVQTTLQAQIQQVQTSLMAQINKGTQSTPGQPPTSASVPAAAKSTLISHPATPVPVPTEAPAAH
jgi:hypothetical protein